MKTNTRWILCAPWLAAALSAASQASPADPADPAPALRYESAFTGYKPWQDIQPGDWRAVNDALQAQPGAHTGPPPAPARAPASAAQAAPPAKPAAPAAPQGGRTHGGHQ